MSEPIRISWYMDNEPVECIDPAYYWYLRQQVTDYEYKFITDVHVRTWSWRSNGDKILMFDILVESPHNIAWSQGDTKFSDYEIKHEYEIYLTEQRFKEKLGKLINDA